MSKDEVEIIEATLLDEAKSNLSMICFDKIDVLIIDENGNLF